MSPVFRPARVAPATKPFGDVMVPPGIAFTGELYHTDMAEARRDDLYYKKVHALAYPNETEYNAPRAWRYR